MDHMPSSRTAELASVAVGLTVAAVVAFLLRVWARFQTAAKHGRDDWLLAVGLAFLIGLNVDAGLSRCPYFFKRFSD